MRMHLGFLVASLAAALIAWPSRSHACSCAVGYVNVKPGNSESGFPRNQAIVIEGYIDPATLVLARLDGPAHAFELLAHKSTGPCGGSWSIELLPTPALDPDAHYELRGVKQPYPGATVAPAETFVSRFRTGSELLPDPELSPPKGRVVVVAPPGNTNTSCGDFDGVGCVSVDSPTDVELVMRDGDEVFSRMLLSERETRLTVWQMPTCIDLVRRAPTGRRSAPLTFCGDDFRKVARGGEQCSGDVFGTTTTADPREAPPPRAAGTAGGSATFAPRSDDEPPPMDADSEHHAYGCAALPRGTERGSPLGALAMIALVGLVALRRRAR